MPRPRNVEESVVWKIYIPLSIARRVEQILYDPYTKKPKNGARQLIVIKALTQFIQDYDGNPIAQLLNNPTTSEKTK